MFYSIYLLLQAAVFFVFSVVCNVNVFLKKIEMLFGMNGGCWTIKPAAGQSNQMFMNSRSRQCEKDDAKTLWVGLSHQLIIMNTPHNLLGSLLLATWSRSGQHCRHHSSAPALASPRSAFSSLSRAYSQTVYL